MAYWNEEAKLAEEGMMCPFKLATQASISMADVGSKYRMSPICIGRRCMAWRWVRTHINDPAGGPDLVESRDTYGYCGLAGVPGAVDRHG